MSQDARLDPDLYAELFRLLNTNLASFVDESCQYVNERLERAADDRLNRSHDIIEAAHVYAEGLLESIQFGQCKLDALYGYSRLQAQLGVLKADVLMTHRLYGHYWWAQLTCLVTASDGSLPNDTLFKVGSALWSYHADFSDAVSLGYRDFPLGQSAKYSIDHASLVENVLAGGELLGGLNSRQALRMFGFSDEQSYFLVIVVRFNAGLNVDQFAAHILEPTLRQAGFPSAWGVVKGNIQSGLVVLSSYSQLLNLSRTLRQLKELQIGASPLYSALPLNGEALRFAYISLSAATELRPVIIFDEDSFTVAAVSNPELMTRYSYQILAGLNELNGVDRCLLLDTFRHWVDVGGSISSTAEALYCHPNTIRYRLRRLKKYTGLDVNNPRDLAELCLAVEAAQTLIHD